MACSIPESLVSRARLLLSEVEDTSVDWVFDLSGESQEGEVILFSNGSRACIRSRNHGTYTLPQAQQDIRLAANAPRLAGLLREIVEASESKEST